MRLSQTIAPTLKESPNDASIPSHALMLRAGLIRKLSSGLYTYLPIGLKALRNVQQIIREEMDAAGAQEFLFPILLERELWEKSGRWDLFKKELFRLKDRNDNDVALGATHEEAFTEFFTSHFQSYKQLPVCLYQMNTKFRDEIRPRFGVMRSKEFIMKDAYSFHVDEESLEETYQRMSQCYSNIFFRCGLDFVHVKADSGSMGGSDSEEFMVKSEVGEDSILSSEDGLYAANVETAVEELEENKDLQTPEIERVQTPNVRSIEELEDFFQIKSSQFIKSLVYEVVNDESRKPILVLIRGDYEVSEVKLANLFPGSDVFLASEQVVKEVTGAPFGFAGPIGLKKDIEIYGDKSLINLSQAVSGANETDTHIKNIKIGRDFKIENWVEVYEAKEGGLAPGGKSRLKSLRGIEVGHIFKLGKKYTKAFDSTVLDENGKSILPTMGCYGIGVNRTLAAVIEQNHDEDGIIWPVSMAPFVVHLITANAKQEEQMLASEKIYNEFVEAGVTVLWDDRTERPGFKFKDADLMGTPIRLVAGKGLAEGLLEASLRRDGRSAEKKAVPVSDALNWVKEQIKLLQEGSSL